MGERDNGLFQNQFKAVVQIVQAVERAAEVLSKNGGRGLPVTDVARLAKDLRLNETGRELLGAMIDQSDTLILVNGHLKLAEFSPPGKVIDADGVEIN